MNSYPLSVKFYWKEPMDFHFLLWGAWYMLFQKRFVVSQLNIYVFLWIERTETLITTCGFHMNDFDISEPENHVIISTWNAGNKMKNKFQRTVQNSNRKILTFLTWYNHFNKKWLVLWNGTSPIGEMMRPCNFSSNMRKIPILTNNQDAIFLNIIHNIFR